MPHHLLDGDHPDLNSAIDLLDDWLVHTMHLNHQPGLALGIVQDGDLLWGKGYGYADLATEQSVTLDTRFRIASITKTFTATAIMQLRDGGHLGLDDPVSQHLEWFSLHYDSAPKITIRNLLTHTSGLPRDSHKPMWTAYEAPSWEDFKEATQKRQPTRPPYDKFAYSNLGYSLLGGIIEAVSGQSWADYVQQNILDPLGMTETRPVPEEDDPLLAKGYSRFDEGYQRKQLPFFLMNGFEASANFASTVNDLVKYAKFHLSKGQTPVLSGHSLRDMHRVHWLYQKWDGGYGLGLSLRRLNEWVLSSHGGGYPGYLTMFSVCREHGFAVIVLTNALNSNPIQYVDQAYKLVLPQVIEATKPATPEPDPAWQKYVGVYVQEWGVTKVVIREGKLQVFSLDAIEVAPTILQPTDEAHVFIIEEAGQSNETARFELDDEGKVVKMWVRNEVTLRRE
ncbi:MAG: beta-lactamase family protein [Chloroflexi bacterium]|nr:beta-lactamase family protein [Chloroflexota bacterium]